MDFYRKISEGWPEDAAALDRLSLSAADRDLAEFGAPESEIRREPASAWPGA